MEEELHNIFIANPLEQVDLLQKNVKVTLKNSAVLQGAVFTVDPVSQSVVLICMEKSKTFNVKVLMKHSIQCIEKISELDSNQKIYLESLFATEKCDSSCAKQKDKVRSWLEKHLIPVVESNSILKIDSLEIHAPYGPEQCFGGNAIVLSRIQNLLRQMP